MPIFINFWLKFCRTSRRTSRSMAVTVTNTHPQLQFCLPLVDSSENCTHIVVKMHSQSLFFHKAFAFIGLPSTLAGLDSVSRNSSHSRYLQATTSAGAFYPPFLSFSCPKFDVTKGHFQQLHTANSLQNIPKCWHLHPPFLVNFTMASWPMQVIMIIGQ